MRDFLLSIGAAQWVLPAMLVWPMAAALLVRFGGRDMSRSEDGTEAPSGGPDARTLTLAALALEALLSLVLWAVYDPAATGWQARVDLPWLTAIGATISLGVDGLALPMVVMTALVLPLALLGSWNNVRVRTPAFGALALMLTTGLIGVFVTLDRPHGVSADISFAWALPAEIAAQSAARVSGACFVMGQAAGLGATMAIKAGCRPAGIDVPALQSQLERDGAWLGR